MSLIDLDDDLAPSPDPEISLTFRLTRFLGSWPFLLGEGVMMVAYLVIIIVSTNSLALFIALVILLGLQTIFSTLLVLRNQWRQEEREAHHQGQYEADLMVQDHTLQDVKSVLHTVSDHLNDIEEKLKIIYGDLRILKQDDQDRARELHRLDQLFALQSTATRSEGILAEMLTLTRRIDERRQQRRRRYTEQPKKGNTTTVPLPPIKDDLQEMSSGELSHS